MSTCYSKKQAWSPSAIMTKGLHDKPLCTQKQWPVGLTSCSAMFMRDDGGDSGKSCPVLSETPDWNTCVYATLFNPAYKSYISMTCTNLMHCIWNWVLLSPALLEPEFAGLPVPLPAVQDHVSIHHDGKCHNRIVTDAFAVCMYQFIAEISSSIHIVQVWYQIASIPILKRTRRLRRISFCSQVRHCRGSFLLNS